MSSTSTKTISIDLPYHFTPRPYQEPILAAMDGGCKRAVGVWHRRAGKDKTFLNYMIKRMLERVGQYYYLYPTMVQGRKALWEGIDRDGFRYMNHFPRPLIAQQKDQEMSIRFRNGSLFRLVGTDRLEVVGPNPVGCVFSEYSLQHPKGWSYIRPILAENQGWAMFNFTPRGHNHGYKLYNMAITNPDWYCERLTVDDTHAISDEAIRAERRAGMPEWMIQQEFYCSFEGSQEGSYYGKVLQILRDQGRIKPDLKHNAALPVYTVHDPGFHWAVWFFQKAATDIVFLRCYEAMGQGVEWHAEELKRIGKENGYRYGAHYAPIDMESNNAYRAVAGKSLVEHARENDLEFIILEPERRVVDGIERTRQFLHRTWFNSTDCELGLDALEDYQAHKIERISTDDRGFFLDTPAENWAVHLCLVGGTKILTTKGSVAIDRVRVGDYVVTPFGKRKVLCADVTGYTNDLVKIIDSDGAEIICTPKHRIFANNSLVTADSLRYGDVLIGSTFRERLVWNIRKKLSSTACDIGFREAITSGLGQQHFIRLYGSFIKAQYRKVIRYITRITTPLTTTLGILSYLRKPNTVLCTESVESGLAAWRISSSLQRREKRRIDGIAAKRVSCFTKLWVLLLGSCARLTSTRSVPCAKENMPLISVRGANTAPPFAEQGQGGPAKRITSKGFASFAGRCFGRISIRKPRRVVVEVVGLKQFGGQNRKEPIYNLIVENDHCYYANGVLVSNCDAMRYASLAVNKLPGPNDAETLKQINALREKYRSPWAVR